MQGTTASSGEGKGLCSLTLANQKGSVERSFALFCQKEVSSTETRLHASWVQLEPFQGLATTGAILEDGPS